MADALVKDDLPNDPQAQQVQDLMLLRTSMGGARPKAVVQADDALWVAKFNRADDSWNNIRVEHAMLRLARECGLITAESRIETVGGKRKALMARFDLTDAEWTIIAPLLPGAEGKKNGRPRPDDRKVLNGIFFVLRTGTPWRDLPERNGPYTTAYNRFNRWAKKGIWLRIFETLAAKSPQSLQLIDSSIVRAHQHAAGGKKGARITPSAVLVED